MKTASQNYPALPHEAGSGRGAEEVWGPDCKTARSNSPAQTAAAGDDRGSQVAASRGPRSANQNNPARTVAAGNSSIGLYRRLAEAILGPVWGRKVLLGSPCGVKYPALRSILTMTGAPLEMFFSVLPAGGRSGFTDGRAFRRTAGSGLRSPAGARSALADFGTSYARAKTMPNKIFCQDFLARRLLKPLTAPSLTKNFTRTLLLI